MSRDRSYTDWLVGVGRQMEAARLMARVLSDMRDIESFDRIKCDEALAAWNAAQKAWGYVPPSPERARVTAAGRKS